jgi:hypothetical protein
MSSTPANMPQAYGGYAGQLSAKGHRCAPKVTLLTAPDPSSKRVIPVTADAVVNQRRT